MRGKWMLTAALAVSLSAAGVATAGQAWAKGPNGKTVCSTVTGTTTGTVTISGCVDAKTAMTGGGSTALTVSTLAVGGTVTWLNGKTTTFGPASLVAGNAHKCPGYVKVKKGQPLVPEPTEFKFSGAVTSDTAGMKVPGAYKGDVCISTTMVITARKALKIN
jgi:hypothetical protein